VRNEGVAANKVDILLNGISLENTVVDVERLKSLRSNLSIKDSDFVMLHMGYLYDFAGLKEIIDYYNTDVKTGKVPFFETTEYIELSDLCLMSFELNEVTKDITPVKVMEYMAMKKPVLSNSLPSVIREIGENNGVIFAQNQRDLIEKIGGLYKKKSELVRIGLKGFELIKKRYLWPNILNDLKKIILDLIKEKKQLS